MSALYHRLLAEYNVGDKVTYLMTFGRDKFRVPATVQGIKLKGRDGPEVIIKLDATGETRSVVASKLVIVEKAVSPICRESA